MPILTYECEMCLSREDFLKIRKDEEEPSTCSNCGHNLKKVPGLSSFQLRGGGWYKDGYASRK